VWRSTDASNGESIAGQIPPSPEVFSGIHDSWAMSKRGILEKKRNKVLAIPSGKILYFLVGGLEPWNFMTFHSVGKNHHPN